MLKSKQGELRMLAGDLSGLYGMQDFTYNEGKAGGMRAIRMDNGKGLSATLLADRCLDIPYFSYKGVNLGLVTKTGLAAPQYFVEDGLRGFLKQFYGGLLTTCGLQTAGEPCEYEGRKYGLHGQIGNTPGYNVNKREYAKGDEIVLQASADMREACVFDEFLELRRTVEMETERNELHVTDSLVNLGLTTMPYVSLYHINFGYPLVDEGARMYFSADSVVSRDEIAEKGFHKYDVVEKAEIGRPEECYVHTGGGAAQFAMLYNKALGLAVAVHYDSVELPVFCQWKCMTAGDYAIGFEPSVAGFWGVRNAVESGRAKYIEPGGEKQVHLTVEVLDDAGRIAEYTSKCKEGK